MVLRAVGERDWAWKAGVLEEAHLGQQEIISIFLQEQVLVWILFSVTPFSSFLPLSSSKWHRKREETGKHWLKWRVWTAGLWTSLQPVRDRKRAAPFREVPPFQSGADCCTKRGAKGSVPQIWVVQVTTWTVDECNIGRAPSWHCPASSVKSSLSLSLSTKHPNDSSKKIYFPHHQDPRLPIALFPFFIIKIPFRDPMSVTCSWNNNNLLMRLWKIIFNLLVNGCLYPKRHSVFNSRDILIYTMWGVGGSGTSEQWLLWHQNVLFIQNLVEN